MANVVVIGSGIAGLIAAVDASARHDVTLITKADLAESKKVIAEKEALVESKNREVRVITESVNRKEALTGLLKTLNKEKASVMASLLEGVQTAKLQSAYDKYLPAVLNNSQAPVKAEKSVLAESRVEVTGDKSAKTTVVIDNNVVDIKRLAGLK